MTQQANTPTTLPTRWGHLPHQTPVAPDAAFAAIKARKLPDNIIKADSTSLPVPSPVPLPTTPVPGSPDPTNALIGGAGNGQGISSIPEQARALRYSIDLFYEYIHDNVEYIPTMGLSKGGLGALVESSGNAFDQCDLLVKLCQQADLQPGAVPFNARFAIGQVKLTTTQWSGWLGVDSTDVVAATQILTNGGIGASYNTLDHSITLQHCWVLATIGGQDYAFDPALKDYNATTGIDLAAAMGYVRTNLPPNPPPLGFIDRAKLGATINPDNVQNINATNINADMTSFTTNLVNWIKLNNPGASFDQILGGRQIKPQIGTVRNLSVLPYQVSVDSNTNTTVPDEYLTLIQIQYDYNVTTAAYRIQGVFSADYIYGKRFTLFFATTGTASLRLDGVVTPAGNVSSVKAVGDLTPAVFTVQHPYATTFADQQISSPIRARGQHFIGTAFGISSKQLANIHQQFQNIYIADGYASTSEELLGTSLNLIWDNFIGQSSNGMDMLDRMSNTRSVLHHLVGTIANLPKPTNTSIKIKSISSFLAAFSTTSRATGPDVTPTAFATSLMVQALEGTAAEQVTGKPSGDAVRITSICNQNGTTIYDAKSSNWTGIRATLNTAGWASSVLDDMEAYITASGPPTWRVIVPNDPTVAIGTFTDFYGYTALASDKTSIISQTWFGAKGAASADGQNEDDTASAAADNARQVNGFGMPAVTATESARVNMSNGRYEYSAQDLTVGNQGAPYSLDFTRFYNSDTALAFNGLGFGWSHNWLMRTAVNSNGFIPFGDQQVSAAASTICALYVLRDIVAADVTTPVENFVIECEVARFMVSQLANNVVRVSIGSSTAMFTTMPDGSYLPAMGMHGKTLLTKDPITGAFTYTTSDKIVHTFNPDGTIAKIEYPFGTPTKFAINFSYTAGKLSTVSNGFRAINFAYDTFGQLHTVNDGTGRTVTFTIDSTTGNLTVVKDPLGKNTTYLYDQRGRLTQVFKPANPTLPVVTNVYDTLSRVKEQHDAYNNVWQFFIAGTRSEEVAPNNTSRIQYCNSFGSILRSINALNQTVTNIFDGNGRLLGTTLPEGNGVSHSYDADGNTLSTTHNPKPGSGLTARTTSFTYDLTWNSVATVTDVFGKVTTNMYGAAGTNGAGKIIQIQEPAVDAGTPNRYFTYTNLGQALTEVDASGVTVSYTYVSGAASTHCRTSVQVGKLVGTAGGTEFCRNQDITTERENSTGAISWRPGARVASSSHISVAAMK